MVIFLGTLTRVTGFIGKIGDHPIPGNSLSNHWKLKCNCNLWKKHTALSWTKLLNLMVHPCLPLVMKLPKLIRSFWMQMAPEFGHFKEALIAYGQFVKWSSQVPQNPAYGNQFSQLSSLLRKLFLSLPSTDYAYSGGGSFPQSLVLTLCCRCHVTCYRARCFLCNLSGGVWKVRKILVLVRLAILNLALVCLRLFLAFWVWIICNLSRLELSPPAGSFTWLFGLTCRNYCEWRGTSFHTRIQGELSALGATKWTMIKTSVLPYAMPGILTSSILGVARAAEKLPHHVYGCYKRRTSEGLRTGQIFSFRE